MCRGIIIGWGVCLALAAGAWAQVPRPGATPPAPAASESRTVDRVALLAGNDETAIAHELESAREQLKRAKADADQAAALPVPADPAEAAALTRRKERLNLLAVNAERHVTAFETLADARRRAAAVRSNPGVTAPPGPPPHSVLLADRIREQITAEEDSLRASTALAGVMGDLAEPLNTRVRQLDTTLRTQTEELAAATDETARARIRTARADTELDLRLVSTEMQFGEVVRAVSQLRGDTSRRRIEAARDQLRTLTGPFILPKEDMDRILARLTARRAVVTKRLTEAIRRHETLAAGTPTTNAPVLNAEEEREAVWGAVEALRWEAASIDLEERTWRARYLAITQSDEEFRRRAVAEIGTAYQTINRWIDVTSERVGAYSSSLVALQSRLDATPADSAEARSLGRLLAACQFRDTAGREALTQFTRLRALIRNWGLQIEDRARESPIRSRVDDWLARPAAALAGAWNFELYRVEDSIVVDGRTVVGSYSITVGKVLRLLAILTVGYFLINWIARRIANFITHRARLDAVPSNVLRQLLAAFGMICLALYGLHAVRIPLTALAFLGGALAIGIGFATQNVIKNLISGFLIHATRPFKSGDILQVGTIEGIVSQIGLRSSLIRHWDGIETLIPNSEFLESRVTNWTYSDHRVRHSVKVGVDYDADPRAVSDALLACTARHALILKDPKPFVVFDDFGDNALIFSVYFWLSVHEGGRMIIASDLRYMIAKAFNEAGISIAFPQRDVRLESAAPVQIEVVHRDPPASP
jgi:small-conductance mechanosensitive channel